jgi:hypothetical protein
VKQETGEKSSTRNLYQEFVLLAIHYNGDEIKKGEMGDACSMGAKLMQNSYEKTQNFPIKGP